ncbi:MAG: hypothetical protein AAF664_18160 [Planctomycetota bacterium]
MPETNSLLLDRLRSINAELASWVSEAPLPSLTDGPRIPLDRSLIASLDGAIRSAVLLVAGELDASHDISQSLHDSLGSYLHGIMHRREGDFSNAKYWFARAGSVAGIDFDPALFVDRVAQAVQAGKIEEKELCDRQWQEWCVIAISALERQNSLG